MIEPTRKMTVGEIKFRQMVSDLMVMEKPSMIIECPNASKARSVRRAFYNWGKEIAEYERNFLAKIEYKVKGRIIYILPKADWVPKEVAGEKNATNSESIIAGSN